MCVHTSPTESWTYLCLLPSWGIPILIGHSLNDGVSVEHSSHTTNVNLIISVSNTMQHQILSNPYKLYQTSIHLSLFLLWCVDVYQVSLADSLATTIRFSCNLLLPWLGTARILQPLQPPLHASQVQTIPCHYSALFRRRIFYTRGTHLVDFSVSGKPRHLGVFKRVETLLCTRRGLVFVKYTTTGCSKANQRHYWLDRARANLWLVKSML